MEPSIVAEIVLGSQFVGLKMNSGRLISTVTLLASAGTPCSISGSGPVRAVTADVRGSICSAALTTTLPRSNGPPRAGTTIDRPKGATVVWEVGWRWAGQVDASGRDLERVGTGPDDHGDRPDLTFRAARAFVGLRFAAQGHVRDRAEQARRDVLLDRGEPLF